MIRLALAGLILPLLFATPAAAQTEAEPVVALALEGPWPSELGAEVRADLRTSLRERGFQLVDVDEHPEGVLATIRLTAPDLDRPVARIEIDDRVNQKRVEREIALGREPPDTWSVLIAAAADELLRASWLELTMADAPPPAIEPPPEMERAARDSIAPTGPTDGPFGVTVGAAIEGYTEGATLAGGDLVGTLFLGDLVAVELAFVARGLIPGASTLGTLDAIAVGGDVGLRLSLLGRSGLARLELCAQLRTLFVEFRPTAAADSVAQPGQDAVLVLRGGPRAAIALDGPVHLGLAVFVGAPLVGVRAVDSNGATLAAIAGLELGARLEVSLWP